MALAPALTPDEITFLREQVKSEHFRVFKKAIEYHYSVECATLAQAKPEDLQRIQGVLQGLLRSINTLMNQAIDTPAPDTRPRVRVAKGVVLPENTPHTPK